MFQVSWSSTPSPLQNYLEIIEAMGLILVPHLDHQRPELDKIPNLDAPKINFFSSVYIKIRESEASMRMSYFGNGSLCLRSCEDFCWEPQAWASQHICQQ